MKASLGISRLGQIAIPARDLARAEAFYKDVLGLPHLFSANGMLAFFDCGGTRLMLDTSLVKDGAPRHSSILYFLVPDIGAAFGSLERQGVKVVDAPHLIARMPDHELWMGFFEDSEGNTLSLMAEVRAGEAKA
ncbi:MAG: VOC family protein [Nevskia sp.]|nr:VOC family protein [Nevskia sp.]